MPSVVADSVVRLPVVSCRVLLIEDDPDYTELVGQWLETSPLIDTGPVQRARTLVAALERLSSEAFDVVLLDLALPDARGLRTARRVVDATTAAVVVLTGSEDERDAIRAIGFGVQEWLVKQASDARTVVRAVRYAMERNRLARELGAARRERERERELRLLERVLRTRADLHDAATETATRDVADRPELLAEYRDVLGRVREARSFRTGYRPTDDLRALATILADQQATPRDVVDLHAAALRGQLGSPRSPGDGGGKARVVVLELMGHLAATYRARAIALAERTEQGGES